jgi:protein fantom
LTDVLEKKKKQIASLERQVNDTKRRDGGRKPLAKERPKSAPDIDIVAARTARFEPTNEEQENHAENAATNNQLLDLVKTYKNRLFHVQNSSLIVYDRLEVAEQQLALASSDNARLRELQLRDPDHHRGGANDELSSQVRDLKWKLQQLQTQYDHVSSKSSAQLEGLKTAEDQLEVKLRPRDGLTSLQDQNQRVRELRRVLEDLRHEKETTDIKAARLEDLEETVIELKRTNRGLEDKIARLCEAPFISDAFGQHESRLEFEKILSERQDYLSKIDHLQEAVRTQYSALVSLKQQAAKLREEKEEAEKNCEDLRTRYSQLEAGTNLLQDKLRLYSGEDGVNIEDLERALTLIKRRSDPIGKLDFLKNADGFEDPVTLPLLKKKAQEIQIINLNLTKEVERLENMLKIQTNINRDLNKELENFTLKKDKDKREVEQRAQDFEELSMKRLNKIHTLEAQLREVVYGLSKKKRGQLSRQHPLDTFGEDIETVSEFGTENILLSELLDEKNGNIDPDENMLEVWVKGASINDGVVSPGSSTFVVFDFFDYESQTTSIMPTSSPHWDFAATYKVTVDDFFLRYLATDGLTFELNMVCSTSILSF